jgi:tetratricopeptide (TPR) repeat protein
MRFGLNYLIVAGIIITLISVQPSSANEAKAVSVASSQDSEKVQAEVANLIAAARKCQSANDLVGAEALFKKALVLNEPFAARHMPYFSDRYSILTSLISMYERQSRWDDIEKLYETNEKIIFSPGDVDNHVAKLLIKQGKYKEARAILRIRVPQMKPPPRRHCGAVDFRYREWQELLWTCEAKTPDATDAELNELWRQRQKKRAA